MDNPSFKMILNDYKKSMSLFQLDGVSVREGKTQYGAYKQALLEFFMRFELWLTALEDFKEILIKKDELMSPVKEILFKVRLESSRAKINLIEFELKRFFQHIIYFKTELGNFDEDQRAVYETEMQLANLNHEIALDLIATDRLSRGTLGYLGLFSFEVRENIFITLKDDRKKSEFIHKHFFRPDSLLPEKLPAVCMKEIITYVGIDKTDYDDIIVLFKERKILLEERKE